MCITKLLLADGCGLKNPSPVCGNTFRSDYRVLRGPSRGTSWNVNRECADRNAIGVKAPSSEARRSQMAEPACGTEGSIHESFGTMAVCDGGAHNAPRPNGAPSARMHDGVAALDQSMEKSKEARHALRNGNHKIHRARPALRRCLQPGQATPFSCTVLEHCSTGPNRRNQRRSSSSAWERPTKSSPMPALPTAAPCH